MKKLVLCLALTAFALVPALRADEAKAPTQAKSACCADSAKSGACCSKTTVKKADATAKGATLLVQR